MPSTSAASSLPVVKISRRGAKRLQDGHVWVYRSDIVSATGVAPGTAVGVTDERGKFLGTALYSSASQIAIRMISSHAVNDLPGLLREIQGQQPLEGPDIVHHQASQIQFPPKSLLPCLHAARQETGQPSEPPLAFHVSE